MSSDLTAQESAKYKQIIADLLAKKKLTEDDRADIKFFSKALEKYGHPVPELHRVSHPELGELILSAFQALYPYLEFIRRSTNTAMAKRKLFVYLVHKRGIKPSAIMHALNSVGKQISLTYISKLIGNYNLELIKVDEMEMFDDYFKGVKL